MDERLIGAAQTGDVQALYDIIKENPFVLEKIDQLPFVETPLHVAISANQTHFAKEIVSLKPSFARKLNQYGYSPLHLASVSGQVEMVKELITIDPKLCLLKGREKRTPLHCASVAGLTDVINLLLKGCPQSLVELTIWKETALHLAVKSKQMEAFEVLFEWVHKLEEIEVDSCALLLAVESTKFQQLTGQLKLARLIDKREIERLWCSFACNNREVEDYKLIKDSLKKVRKEEVLNWKDQDGNTVLHLATFSRQREIIKTILGNNPTGGTQMEVNAVNGNNQTALDILFQLQRAKEDEETETMLCQAGAMTASQIITPIPPPSKPALVTPNKTFELRGRPPPGNSNNQLIIVAITIAIAFFVTGIYPPGGVWQDNYKFISNTTTTEHKAGTAVMATSVLSTFFMFFNSYGFFVSLLLISVIIKGSPSRWLFLCVLAIFSIAYLLGFALITPPEKFSEMLNIFLLALGTFFLPHAVEAWCHFKKYKGSQATKGEVRVSGAVI